MLENRNLKPFHQLKSRLLLFYPIFLFPPISLPHYAPFAIVLCFIWKNFYHTLLYPGVILELGHIIAWDKEKNFLIIQLSVRFCWSWSKILWYLKMELIIILLKFSKENYYEIREYVVCVFVALCECFNGRAVGMMLKARKIQLILPLSFISKVFPTNEISFTIHTP